MSTIKNWYVLVLKSPRRFLDLPEASVDDSPPEMEPPEDPEPSGTVLGSPPEELGESAPAPDEPSGIVEPPAESGKFAGDPFLGSGYLETPPAPPFASTDPGLPVNLFLGLPSELNYCQICNM